MIPSRFDMGSADLHQGHEGLSRPVGLSEGRCVEIVEVCSKSQTFVEHRECLGFRVPELSWFLRLVINPRPPKR